MNRITPPSTALRRWYTSLLFVVGLVLALLIPGGGRVETALLDLRFMLRGPRIPSGQVILVTVDDVSFDMVDLRWPWPRTYFAAAIDRLSQAGVRAIGIDIALSEAGFSPENDRALADAIRQGAPVVIPEKFELQEGEGYSQLSLVEPEEVYLGTGARRGYVNLLEDPDGRVRRLLLSQEHNGTTHYPFSLQILAAGTKVSAQEALAKIEPSYGRTFLIPFAGPGGTLTRVPIGRVLAGTTNLAIFNGGYVLIGATFKEAHDNAPTPFFSGSPMSGVEIHGQALEAMMTGRRLEATSPTTNLLLLLFLSATLTLFLHRFGPGRGGILLGIFLAGLFTAGIVLFNRGVVLRMATPMSALLIIYLGSLLFYYLFEKRRGAYVRSLFSRYVSPAVVGQILADPANLELGGEQRDVTLFFSDIRGFTSFSESKSPQEIVTLLNEYFDAMTQVIFRHGGTVNKFIGDAIMAFYGAPLRQDDAPRRALRACLDMRRELAKLNEKWKSEGAEGLRIGMALHTGTVLLGNIGSTRQMEYTVIGDAVNVCSRIESMTKELGTDLLISDAVYRDVADMVAVETHEDLPIRGREQKITLHAILSEEEAR